MRQISQRRGDHPHPWHLYSASAVILTLIPWAADAAAVPPQAFGKTVTFNYTASTPAKLPNGSVINTSRTETRTIYISSTGRIFMRNARRNSANATDRSEEGPEQSSGGLRFENGAIVGAVRRISGAYQFTIKFDASFQSCSAEMIFGRAEGEGVKKWKSVGGKVLEAAGKGSVSTSCSVASGNAL